VTAESFRISNPSFLIAFAVCHTYTFHRSAGMLYENALPLVTGKKGRYV